MWVETSLSFEEQIKSPLKIGKHIAWNRFVWWGMWSGVSTWPLVWEIANQDGIGTLSSAGLYMLSQYKYLLDDALLQAEKIQNPIPENIKTEIYRQVQLECIRLEVTKAKKLANGKWLVFMNFLFALESFDEQVLAACKAGVDWIVSGAGIAWNLPKITKDYPNVAIGIMLSDPKWIGTVIKKYLKDHGRTPDFFIFEDPNVAAWHLWVRDLEKIPNTNLSLSNSIPEAKRLMQEMWYNIPIIWAWGIANNNQATKTLSYWADAVQLWTRLLASKESWAHDNFKQAVVNSSLDDIITWMSSVWLPARWLRQSPILERMQRIVAKERKCIEDCLIRCWFRDGIKELAQMCILRQLIASTQWSNWNWLMFAGKIAAEIHDILSVKQIMRNVLTAA